MATESPDLGTISEQDRRIVELHVENGLRGSEIAEELGIHQSSVSNTFTDLEERGVLEEVGWGQYELINGNALNKQSSLPSTDIGPEDIADQEIRALNGDRRRSNEEVLSEKRANRYLAQVLESSGLIFNRKQEYTTDWGSLISGFGSETQVEASTSSSNSEEASNPEESITAETEDQEINQVDQALSEDPGSVNVLASFILETGRNNLKSDNITEEIEQEYGIVYSNSEMGAAFLNLADQIGDISREKFNDVFKNGYSGATTWHIERIKEMYSEELDEMAAKPANLEDNEAERRRDTESKASSTANSHDSSPYTGRDGDFGNEPNPQFVEEIETSATSHFNNSHEESLEVVFDYLKQFEGNQFDQERLEDLNTNIINGDYAVVDLIETPGGDVWGKHYSGGSPVNTDHDQPEAEYALVETGKRLPGTGLTHGEIIETASGYDELLSNLEGRLN